MKPAENTPQDPNERLDPRVHRDLGKLGWKTPQLDMEVRAAEEFVANSPGELPERLRGLPSPEPHKQGPSEGYGHLDSYLRDEDRSDSGQEGSKSMDTDHRSLDLDRE